MDNLATYDQLVADVIMYGVEKQGMGSAPDSDTYIAGSERAGKLLADIVTTVHRLYRDRGEDV